MTEMKFTVYCHGEPRKALYVGDGKAICLCCGTKFKAVPPE